MKQTRKIRKYKLEDPDGGWGYLVCLGMCLVFISAGAGMHCFGLIFNDFLKSIGVGSSVVAISSSFSFGAMSFAGLLSNTLFQKFGKRAVGVAGAVVFCIGTVFQVFAQSSMHLFIGAAIHGASFGLMIPVIFSTFNHYFVRKRALMMSLTQTVIGIGNMGIPLFVEFLMDKFGFRGCLAILTGINAHCIFAMLVMHPVEWHMKRVPITEEEMQKQKIENKDQLKPLITEFQEKNHLGPKGSIRRLKAEESAAHSRRSSLASLTNWTGSVIITEAIEPEPKTAGKLKLFLDFLDLKLLKQPVYVNIVLGVTLSFYADISFFSFQPLYLFELNYSQIDIARIISIGAGADLLSRCALAVLTGLADIPARYIYLGGVVFSIAARYVFLYVTDFWSMAIITAILGALKTWIHIPMPLIFAEYLPKERFSSGYGLFMFLQGMIIFAIGPIVGFIRDSTNSYSLAFQFLNTFLIANAIAWLTEIFWVKCTGSKKSNGGDPVKEAR